MGQPPPHHLGIEWKINLGIFSLYPGTCSQFRVPGFVCACCSREKFPSFTPILKWVSDL